jgi:hypothetical protein
VITIEDAALQPRQQFAYTTGKNSPDSLMIIDAMDMLYKERFDALLWSQVILIFKALRPD